MIDKTALFLIDEYINELGFLANIYQRDFKNFSIEIDALCDKSLKKIKTKANESDEELSCIMCCVSSSFEDKKYIYLSGIIQNIISLWENQMNDFYLLSKCKDYNELKDSFKKDNYYKLGKTENFNLYEMRLVGNYLKHGQFGSAEKDLISINSKYYNNNGQFGELRGDHYRSKQLNISKTDIKYFTDLILKFWKDVKDSIIQKG